MKCQRTDDEEEKENGNRRTTKQEYHSKDMMMITARCAADYKIVMTTYKHNLLIAWNLVGNTSLCTTLPTLIL